MSDCFFSLCTGATGRGGGGGGLRVLKCQPSFCNRCTRFIEQLEDEVSVMKISLCAVITCRSANQKVDNRRQSRASLDSLLMERLTN